MPRRPGTAGALLGLAGGLLMAGSAALAPLLHDVPDYAKVLLVVPFGVGLLGLFCLGAPYEKHMLVLGICGIALLILGNAGVGSAVLSWRGERVQATVTEVTRQENRRAGSVSYGCKVVDAEGRTDWVRDGGRCGRDSRPGDRYEILRDPDDLVPATTTDPPITFAVLVPVTGTLLLLMSVSGALAMKRRVGDKEGKQGRKPDRKQERKQGRKPSRSQDRSEPRGTTGAATASRKA
ncbi:hypothetical protein ACWCXC_01480 [Streptomyces sp. NPDC001515]